MAVSEADAHRQTATALRIAQKKLIRMEQALRGIRAAGEREKHIYAQWVRSKVDQALGESE